jgi:selenide,water dikinase
MIAQLRFTSHPNLLVGLGKADDAAVYQINATQAFAQTVDFFPQLSMTPTTTATLRQRTPCPISTPWVVRLCWLWPVAAFPDSLPATVTSQILQGASMPWLPLVPWWPVDTPSSTLNPNTAYV